MNALEKILVDLALSKHVIEQAQLDKAFDIQKSSPMKNFGRILADLGFVTEKQLEELKREAESIFRNKGRIPSTANGRISLKQNDDFSEFLEDSSVKRYSKPRQSEIFVDSFEKKGNDRLVGTEFVGCKIIKKLGQGGMGKIYKVKHLFLNKYMAMKILSQQHTEQKQFVQRFFREARSAAKLNHPNIVKIFDVGVMNGEYYMLMQLVDGIDLKKIIEERGRLSIRDAIYVIAEVAKALAEAHDHKIVHRDIKPDNIMLDKTHVMVTDFGLAKIEKGEGEGSEIMTLTGPGQVLGSPYFMAPEQADSSHGVDNRTDIYSLGSTFYYLITGKYPYDGPNAIAIIFKRVNDPLIRPKKLDPLIPECVNKLIIRMMALHRENRPESARKLLREIEELPLKNKVRNFGDMDYHKNVDIDESNRLLSQSELPTPPQISKVLVRDRVAKSKAKTKIRKVKEVKPEVRKTPEPKEDKEASELLMVGDYDSVEIVEKPQKRVTKPKSEEFVAMTDFNEEKSKPTKVVSTPKVSKAPKIPPISRPSSNVRSKAPKLVKPSSQVTSLINQAQNLFETRKYPQALRAFKGIQTKYPDNEFVKKKALEIEEKFKSANNHYRNAQKLYAVGEVDETIKELKESLNFLPGNPDIIKFLNKVIKSNSEINKILNNAYSLYKTGKIPEAIQKASESFKFVKNHPKTRKLIEKLQKVLDKRSV